MQGSGVVPAGTAGKKRLFWYSFLGIVLGGGVGGMVLFFFLEKDKGKAPTAKRSIKSKVVARTPANWSPQKATTRELYRKSRQEAETGQFGPTTDWLHRNRRNFVLWVHVYWQLAQGSLKRGSPLQAARVFKTLVDQKSYLWSPRWLYWHAASSLHKGGKKAEAKKLLAKSLRRKRPRGKHGWLWRQQDRFAVAESLWLYASMKRGATRFRLWQRLWLDYPESQRAKGALQKWWGERRKRKPGKKLLLRAAGHLMNVYGEFAKGRQLLRGLKRIRSRSQKRQYQEHMATYATARNDWKGAWRALKKMAKTKRRSRRGKTYYEMAQVALKMKRTRTWRSTLRLLRRSRYWYAQTQLQKGRYQLAMGSLRSAERSWRKAWRKSRSKTMRMQIHIFRGLGRLKGSKRSARKARGEFRQALRQFKRMRRREKRQVTPGMLDYWLARSDQRRGKKAAAAKAWRKIFQRAPFSFYGLLASRRLQAMGKLPPLKTRRTPQHIWQPGPGKSRQVRLLRLLQAEGPQSLLALELEAFAVKKASPPLPLLVYLAQHSKAGPTHSNALLWLHQVRSTFLNTSKQISRNLLMTAYPFPAKRWPAEIKQARSYGLDVRLVAALLLHKRGFHPNSRRSQRPGLTADPLWLPTPLNPPRSFAANCQMLRSLLQKYKNVGLALEALLTQDPKRVAGLQRTFGAKVADLRYPLMSADTRTILQTYWIYKYLYLQ